jgi:hypothetical protein
MDAMKQFRVERNQYGHMLILEHVRKRYGYEWRCVCLRHFNNQTGAWE